MNFSSPSFCFVLKRPGGHRERKTANRGSESPDSGGISPADPHNLFCFETKDLLHRDRKLHERGEKQTVKPGAGQKILCIQTEIVFFLTIPLRLAEDCVTIIL